MLTDVDHKTKYIDWYIQNNIATIKAALKDFVFVNKNKNIQLNDINEYVIPVTKPYIAEYFILFLYIQYIKGTKDTHTRKKKLNF